MSTAISIVDLVKSFGPATPPSARGGAGTRANAVDRVSLEIAPGELFFLLGPSGCGKTTLLRMVAGFIEPTSGAVRFGGRDVTFTPPNKRNTGMVFQSYALWPHMTVEANVGYGLTVRGVKGEEKSRRVRAALEAVRMEDYALRRPNQLSGGQQQRVALARALVIRPDVLLLDEPLSNLDAKLRLELRAEIRRICKASGITTLYVTHDQKEALSMADRVAIIDAGRVVQLGPPAELYRRPASRFIAEFLGETNFIEAVVVEAAASGVVLETPAGRIAAANLSSPAPVAGGRVSLSVRPESIRLLPPGAGGLAGRIVESVYLGEIAQHTVELGGGVRLKASQLNPGTVVGIGAAEGAVCVSVAPDDVVILRVA